MNKTPGLLSWTATRSDEEILQQLCRDNPTDGSVYSAIGLHESGPLLELFKFPAFSMVSRSYNVYQPEDSQFAERLDNRLPYFKLGSL